MKRTPKAPRERYHAPEVYDLILKAKELIEKEHPEHKIVLYPYYDRNAHWDMRAPGMYGKYGSWFISVLLHPQEDAKDREHYLVDDAICNTRKRCEKDVYRAADEFPEIELDESEF